MSRTAIFDDELARRLNEVSVPAGLLSRLRALALADDTDLDGALADLPLPADLLARCQTLAQPVTERDLAAATLDFGLWTLDFEPAGARKLACLTLKRAAAAAAVFLVGMGYTLSVVAFVAPRFEGRAWAGEGRPSLVAVSQLVDPFVEQMSSELESSVDLEFSAVDDDDLQQIRTSSPQVQNVAAMSGQPLAIAAANYASYSVPTFDSSAFSRLDARTIKRAAVRLTDPRRFNDRFFRQTGLLPWLVCAEAASVETPLVYTDAGYRFLRQQIHSGLLPRFADIHVEEVVAGIDYGLSNEDLAGPSIRLATAPSPFTPPGQSALTEDPLSGTSRWLVMIAAVMPAGVEHAERSDQKAAPGFKLTFKPDHVVRYRILGYAPPGSDFGSQSHDDGEETNQTLLFGGAAVTLCEIEIAECDPLAELLEVRLAGAKRGHPVDTETAATATAVLRAEGFAADFDAAPVAWRQAALAALAAELLAGSPFAEQCSLAEITAIAQQLEPLVYDRAGWRDFIDTLVRAQTLRSSLLRAF
ncbi:MAG TPA: hypothetical protein VFI31_05590 [Pirellulales bacterium]|nr:hypothetical protein [Pirellulales bacterium]